MTARLATAALAGAALLASTGCFTAVYRVEVEPKPYPQFSDASTASPRLGEAPPESVLVLPPADPSAEAPLWRRGQPRLAALERGFVARGGEVRPAEAGTSESAAQEEVGKFYDALLVFDEFRWVPDRGARYFRWGAPIAAEMLEVTKADYAANDHLPRWEVAGPTLYVRARLLDKEGKTLASYAFEAHQVDLPHPGSYGVSFTWAGPEEGVEEVVSETPKDEVFGEAARRELESRVLTAIAGWNPFDNAPYVRGAE